MARRDHISAERQGLISHVNMGSSVEESVRGKGTEEGEACNRVRKQDARSDNPQEERIQQSFPVHNVRGECIYFHNNQFVL